MKNPLHLYRQIITSISLFLIVSLLSSCVSTMQLSQPQAYQNPYYDDDIYSYRKSNQGIPPKQRYHTVNNQNNYRDSLNYQDTSGNYNNDYYGYDDYYRFNFWGINYNIYWPHYCYRSYSYYYGPGRNYYGGYSHYGQRGDYYNRSGRSYYGSRSAPHYARRGPAYNAPHSIRGGFGSTGSRGMISARS